MLVPSLNHACISHILVLSIKSCILELCAAVFYFASLLPGLKYFFQWLSVGDALSLKYADGVYVPN